MAFVDELKLHIKAGNGGDGVVRWRREKFIDKGGPAGGNGGNGGNVILRAIRNSMLFEKYAREAESKFVAEHGEDGRSKSQHGRDGEDLIIDVPVGTIATNLSTDTRYDLSEDGQMVQILRGGRGGLGNEHFKSATNQAPKEFTEGKPGEEADFLLELELIADAGFVGFPNAGKSSLLNELTNATSKVGAYQFTTLEPHLGELYGFILADIPGLIEGASVGKGLGHKFLRHIRRTRCILHCLTLEEEDLGQSYNTIRKELERFDQTLIGRPEFLILTKSDAVSEEKIRAAKRLFSNHPHVHVVSILDEVSIKSLSDSLVQFLSSH